MLVNILLSIIKTTEENNIVINDEFYEIESQHLKQNLIKDEEYLLEIKQELLENKKNYNEINSDFIKLEEEFNEKFNNFIEESKNLQEEIKTKPETFYDSILNFFFNTSFENYRDKEIKNLFFKELLNFYDEYSFRINYKIDKINLNDLEEKLNNLNELSSLTLINKEPIDLNDITNNKYLDLYYFINKLEEKISESFDISIEKIKNILYGEDITDDFIKSFYKKMLEIRKRINYFYTKEEIEIKHQSSNELLFEYPKDYITYIMPLYNYHIDTNPETEVERARFNIFRDYLRHYRIFFGRTDEFEIMENTEENKKLMDYDDCLYVFYKSVIPSCFSHISYLSFIDNSEDENVEKVSFFKKFNEKDRLISLIEKYNKIIE